MARAGLRPLRRIIATTGSIRTSTLTARIVLAGLPAELHELGLTFNRMLDRLEEAFASLRQFSDDIAHELRTPIGSILGAAEVTLGQTRPAAEYRDALESIAEDASLMSRTVQSLLFLARSENPAMRIARETVDIARELGLIREFYDAMASEAGVRIAVEAEPQLAAAADRTLLQRAVSNLVANGLEHTPPGGTVRISGRREGPAVVVEVADTGRGIAPEHLPHVFDRFYRIDRTRSAAGGNVGLGLAIAKTVATLHGGTASIESAIGRGTRVTIRIPASIADA
jgi:two-component system heavy metal sensor histidine kinase CusS